MLMGLSGLWGPATALGQSANLMEEELKLKILEKELGSDHPDVATCLNNLAALYKAMGNYAAAEPLFKRSLAIFEKELGSDHLDVAICLNNLAALYKAMGNYAAAEPLYKRSLAIREKVLGPNHPYVATCLNNLALLYYAMGNYAAAEPLLKRSLAIFEKALGPNHPDVATSLNNLAELYRAMGNYAAAEPLYKRSLAIFEKVPGPNDPDVAASLNNLALLYQAMGNYAAAEPLFKRSLAIREKVFGPNHPAVAASLGNLAGLYQAMGNYAAAEPLFKRSLAISEKVLDPNHPDFAVSLGNLALLYQAMGNYAAAEPLFKRSLAIREKVFGPNHPDVAASLGNLAGLYQAMGNYAAAEPLYKLSLAINEKVLGPNHPAVAASLNGLAALYQDMGNYAAAEPLFKRSLAIREKVLDPNHPAVATSLSNLAGLYRAMGNYAAAEPLLKRSLAIFEKVLGPNHPAVAASLNNLAALYHNMGNYAAAEPLFKRSLAIFEKALGPDHPDVANSLNNLATLYLAMGNYAAAEPLFKRSLAIFEKALGPNHPAVATSLQNYSFLYAEIGKSYEAFQKIIQSENIMDKMIDQVSSFTSGDQTMKYLSKFQGGTEMCLSLVNAPLKENVSARKEAYGVWLRRKGVVLENQRRMQQALLDANDPESARVFEELSLTRSSIAQMTFSGPGKETPEVYQKRLKDLYAKKEELESKLSRLSQAYAQARKARKITVDELSGILPKGTVLVDFARTNIIDFSAGRKDKTTPAARYLAFVLFPGKGKDVLLFDLGPADEIDTTITQFKKTLTQDQQAGTKNLGRRLHDLVFAPFQKALGKADRIFISPDGELALLPFEVLINADGKYLIENYTFNYLTAGRDMASFSEKKAGLQKPVLVGDPDFDLDAKRKNQILDQIGLRGKSTVATSRSVPQKGLEFDRLPGTRKEVTAIETLLGKGQCELFLDNRALKEVLLTRESPRILHLATHGFFLKDQDLSTLKSARGVGGMISFLSRDDVFGRSAGPGAVYEDPLLKSGIALAGANRAETSDQGSEGIMTAEEILGLRLRGTDLVVLSACETGLGEIKTTEGIFGLARAFKQVGARSMIMSMWEVDDESTRELMVEFYKNIQSGKLDRCQSLRQAALKIKAKYGDNPYYWGPFVFLGKAD
jgi:CHAT domain-containing protein/Tfp pilus assembly protein PilF